MISYFTKHPTAANLVMIGFIVIGLFAAPTLQRETFPRLESRFVQILAIYPGARAEEVEEAVCQRIEDAIDAVSDVEEVTCASNEGVAKAIVEMIEGSDLDRFTSDIKTQIDAITDFPDLVEKPVISQLGRIDFVASVVITGPENKTDLKALAENLKEVLLAAGGIPKVAISGFSDRQFRIEIPQVVLRQYGLSAGDIARAIQRQNIDLPSGNLKTSQADLLVRFADQRKTVADISNLIVVSASGGGQIRLGDIAKITDRFELEEDKILFNGKQAAVLNITKTEKEDTLNVIERVRAVLKVENKKAPAGVSFEVSRDLSSIVKDRLRLLLTNGAQGLSLVFLVLWLFFGFRYSFWVAAGLPVSFLGALAMMSMFGYTINMISMVGLLIVIGLLMDDAIVIAENIASQRAAGKSASKAAIDGTKQVLPSVFASFVTTTFVFGSLAFLKGNIGQILEVIPAVMLLVLLVSLIEAFWVLPNHLSHSMAKNEDNKQGRVQIGVNNAVAWLGEKVVKPLADLAVRWRYLTVGIAVGGLIITISMIAGGVLKFSPFPDIEGNVIEARILLPQGTPLERTKQVVGKVTSAIKAVDKDHTTRQPENAHLVENITVKYSQNQDANETGPHVATIVVDLLSSEVRTSRIADIIADWRKATGVLPDVVAIRFTESTLGPGGLAIDIRLAGKDLGVLKTAALEMKTWLTQFDGVLNVIDDLRPGKREIRVKLKDGASSLGVDARMIADQLRSAFFGSTVSEIQRGTESFEVDVRVSPNDSNSLGDLDYFTITTTQGKQIPLAVVANVDFDRGVSRINRVNGLRTVTVQGDIDSRYANAGEILAKAKKSIFKEIRKKHPEISIGIKGSNNDASKTQASMVQGFIIGLIGVYLLLSFQFRSYVEPIVVMIIVPFAFIGAVWGHIALGLEFTMPSMMGFVALAGVVVNDSILLVNFIKHHHGTTKSVVTAAPLASQARLRAILLTSLTTVAGLMPLLFETSPQAQILIPLVTSLAFGLTSATVLVLFLVPAVYAIIDDAGWASID